MEEGPPVSLSSSRAMSMSEKSDRPLRRRTTFWTQIVDECLDWYDWFVFDLPFILRALGQLNGLFRAGLLMSIFAYTFRILHLPFDILITEEPLPVLALRFTIVRRRAAPPSPTSRLGIIETPGEEVEIRACEKLEEPIPEAQKEEPKEEKSPGKRFIRYGALHNMRKRGSKAPRKFKPTFMDMGDVDEGLDDLDETPIPHKISSLKTNKGKSRKERGARKKVTTFADTDYVFPSSPIAKPALLHTKSTSTDKLNILTEASNRDVPPIEPLDFDGSISSFEESPPTHKKLPRSKSKHWKAKK